MSVRVAVAADIPRIVELCEEGRRRYSTGHANYYRVASDFAEKKLPAVNRLVESNEALALVHETDGRIDGLILGIVVNAPPVYDPGGKVCLIDEFLVVDDTNWSTVGNAIVYAVNDHVRELGCVLLIVEAMYAAASKRDVLFEAGFSVASDWYCRDIDVTYPQPLLEAKGVIEVATAADVPAIIELAEQTRLRYQGYQPVFWRKAADSAEKHAGFISWVVGNGNHIVVVHRVGETIDGFIVADPSAASPLFDRGGPSCNVDDFAVANEGLWPVGASLLCAAVAEAKSRGAVVTQVICGDSDVSKRRMLVGLGYQLGHEWIVRSTIA